MKKKSLFYILSTVSLVVITSGISGVFGYKIGKQEGALEKDAAVKGIEYDLKEKLSEEALGKAQGVANKDTENIDGQKIIKSFYELINEEKYEDAWDLFSDDYKKTLKSANNFKYSFRNFKTIEVKNVEFRTSSPQSEMDIATLDITYKTPNSTQKDGEKSFYINTVGEDDKWLIDEIEEK